MTSSFGQRLRDAKTSVESADGTVRITLDDSSGLRVRLADDALRVHTESSLERQVNAAVAALLGAARRTYVEARRAATEDDVPGGSAGR